MEKILVRNSKWKNIFYAVLSLIVGFSFVFIGYQYIGIPKITSSTNDISYWISNILLYISVFFFWMITLLLIWGVFHFSRAFLDVTPQVIFDEEGISAKTINTGKVLWNEIEKVYLVDENTIRLQLNNEDKYKSEIQTSKFFRKFPHFSVNLNFLGTDMKASQAIQIIESRLTNLTT